MNKPINYNSIGRLEQFLPFVAKADAFRIRPFETRQGWYIAVDVTKGGELETYGFAAFNHELLKITDTWANSKEAEAA